MATRRPMVLMLVAVWALMGASYRSPQGNFVVEAPSYPVAKQVGDWAEYYRKEKAIQWLRREMPPWQQPCPIHVKLTLSGPGGATSFNFLSGQVWQTMQIEGPLDRLLASVLPHEVTHTVFAFYFRTPVPRWADEGGAVLSEDELERSRHDQMVRQILNARRAMALRQLFTLRDYPHEVGTLYAEGYSVADFLVGISDRPTFLQFVAHGMQYGWDSATQTVYRYRSVEELEQAWLNHLIQTKRQPQNLLASNTSPMRADPAQRVIVRLTAPPVQPLEDAPAAVVRGQAPESEPVSGWAPAPRQPTAARPGYLPEPSGNANPYPPQPSFPAAPPTPAPPDRWQPPPVRLGPPQYDPPPPGQPVSPAGYPN